MKLVALTGGIGSGKTTVAEAFARLGVPCFIADKAAATLYDDPLVIQRVETLLGQSISNNGVVDKRAIADIIFHDANKRHALNALIHPLVMQQFEQWTAQHQSMPYLLFESAILYEEHLEQHFNSVVVVYCGLTERLERLQQRNATTADRLRPIIEAQMDDEEKMRRADYVILNYEGNPRQRQVDHIHSLLCRP